MVNDGNGLLSAILKKNYFRPHKEIHVNTCDKTPRFRSETGKLLSAVNVTVEHLCNIFYNDWLLQILIL